MVYKIICIGDIHWGAMPPDITEKNLELFLEFIRQSSPDLIVICGDYFDYKLQLNSPSAITALNWFDKFYNVCISSGVKAIRLLKGTQDHDNDQLNVFSSYEDESNYFKLYTTTETDYPLPNLKCVYCPDELMNLEEYHQTYFDKFIPISDIGFFHGNFDCILPSIEFDRIQSNHIKTMIYEYEKFSKLIKGPLISGHWHIASENKSLYYTGSYDRWKFGEEEPKGFIYCEYDTETHNYYIHRVENILAKHYDTLIIRDIDYIEPSSLATLKEIIDKKLTDEDNSEIKLQYLITEDNNEAHTNFNIFSKQFLTNPRIKISIKDILKKRSKKAKKEATQFETSKYNYIFEKSISIKEKIHQYILDKKGIDIPIEDIDNILRKYL